MRKSLHGFIINNRHRFVSPLVVLSIDLILVMGAFIAAYLLRFNFSLTQTMAENMFHQTLAFGAFNLIAFLIFRPYKGIIRHTSLNDVFRLFLSVTIAVSITWFVCNMARIFVDFRSLNISLAVLLTAYMSSLFFLFMFRFTIKVVYMSLTRNRIQQENLLIFGAGEMGVATQKTIDATTRAPFRVVGFVDDNPAKRRKTLGGVSVYGPKVLNRDFLDKHNVSQVVLAVQNISIKRRKHIIEQCLELGVEVMTVPGFKEWKKGQLNFRQIHSVDIRELLQRDPIKIKNKLVGSQIKDKVVLVTGAAGSIGSELARQIRRLQPAKLILLDQAETPLFDVEQEFCASYNGDLEVIYVLGDVGDKQNTRRVFEQYRPDIVYHAAAYKHVPMIESNPMEALRVNVFGTHNIAMLAFEFHTSTFVLISTDKAVNPASFMGVSKRLAEILVQSLGQFTQNNTRFITTRFGNVLGSNGSVIPIFRKQIAEGGPVTVTHPEMTRFFMTIPEACELVLEASVMGRGGQILVFDMGKQVRILDVAKKMIRLSGLEPGKDIEIAFTGLRPGEKMYEELFSEQEENIATHHPKIMIAKVRSLEYKLVEQKLNQLRIMMSKRSFVHILSVVKELVPEYIRKEETPHSENGQALTDTAWQIPDAKKV